METSLHRALKGIYAQSEADTEVRLGEFRIDAVRRDELIEIQFASLASIRDKIAKLVETRKLRVVKPIVFERRIVRQDVPDGPVVSRRLSPKRGKTIDLFDELVFLTRVFPHPNLIIEVPLVSVEEWRLPPSEKPHRRRRWRAKHHVKDVVLAGIVERHTFRSGADLKRLAGLGAFKETFDTSQLAQHLSCQRHAAQKIAYVLRNIGVIREVDKRGNALVYQVNGRRRPKAA